MKYVFVVTMYRYGNREKHSYVLGAFSNALLAEAHAQAEILWRGGKYKPEIIMCPIDPEMAPDENEMVARLGEIN